MWPFCCKTDVRCDVTEVASEQRAEQGAAEEQRIQEEEVEQNLADADQRIQDLEAQVT